MHKNVCTLGGSDNFVVKVNVQPTCVAVGVEDVGVAEGVVDVVEAGVADEDADVVHRAVVVTVLTAVLVTVLVMVRVAVTVLVTVLTTVLATVLGLRGTGASLFGGASSRDAWGGG